ncbi:MAG TPA: RtcB family protein [Melioribacteraceae bacterium]|nr:RtcB family protein [Melioribacteraceae bacterium]
MKISGIELHKITDNLWEIPKSGIMNVAGRVYADIEMLNNIIAYDEALKQVINVATLPGIVNYSLAMPDIHWGYGFPIGGVAATDIDNGGVISPGGVGYDINCGVRLATTGLQKKDIINKFDKLLNKLFSVIPTGIGSSGAIKILKPQELKILLTKGANWGIENGYGNPEDLIFTEENGCIKHVDSSFISNKAIERGLDQVGTLGSGNHFIEIDFVEEIYDDNIAKIFGLSKNQIVVLIHTGSRGLGYQICDEYLMKYVKSKMFQSYNLPDRQLACMPVKSPEGEDYINAMNCAANFAWNNRQIIMSLVKTCFKNVFNIDDKSLDFNLLYDLSHNIAKIEYHKVNGQNKKLCVHRKGATRAFGPNEELIPLKYKDIGQPVLIPGDMGRYSFIACGTTKAMEETFGSSCHGAGRVLSRNKALQKYGKDDLVGNLKKKGIIVLADNKKTIAEEISEAYKNVENVINIMHNSGITKKIAKIKPLGVIKG